MCSSLRRVRFRHCTRLHYDHTNPVMLAVIRLKSMLDLDRPDTPPTFAISREDDAILSIAKRMTLVSTEAKRPLLAKAAVHFANMRSITIKHWGESRAMLETIELLQSDLHRLAGLASVNDFVSD